MAFKSYLTHSDEENRDTPTQHLLNATAQQQTGSNDLENEDLYYYSDEKTVFDDEDAYHSGKKGVNWVCVGLVSVLGLAWLLWTVSMAQLFTIFTPSADEMNDGSHSNKRFQFEDVFNSSFSPKRTNLVWVENDPRDGIYTYRDPNSNDILLESIEDRKSQVFVQEKDLKIDGNLLNVQSFELSHDAEYLLFKTNITAKWRHSALFNAYLFHVSSKKITPLSSATTVNSEPKISYAAWSPTGHQLAYVMNNDIYITDLVKHQRITFDGSKTIFNGIPDWVYEEEVLASDFALWWAPDSSHLAYLKLDETKVPEYHVQMFTSNYNASYPKEDNIKYPKAGAPNPLASLHVYSLSSNKTITATSTTDSSNSIDILKDNQYNAQDFKEDDRLIVDVAWATDSHTHLLFKQTNRIQDQQVTNMIQIDSAHLENSTIKSVHEYKPTDGGWIDVSQSIVHLPSDKDTQSVSYLDILDNNEGFAHLAIITVTKEKVKTTWLTNGSWEVVSGTVQVDPKRQLIHFVSTERSPHERHLYRLSLKNRHSSKTCITCPSDPEEHAYYTATFSPQSGYYILNYEGPDVPTTVVRKVDDDNFSAVLQNNTALKSLLQDYDLPKMHMKTISSGGVEMTAMEVLPADFDAKKKYPVLFHVYGGPGSQLVSYRFELSWQTFVASQLGFIVVTVDGRGTGFQGRKYRMGVRGRLGELETIDQVNAAKHWAQLDYVDEYRMAIWGWSYGGYMTSKVIESNDGVFSTGMAVAPVTDWRYYDSVYTERYMKTPELNPEGYAHSAVDKMEGFKNARYLLAHGTGDDNVHFQHTAVLVDKLTLNDIHNYRVQIYPDSNHAIRHHNANKNVYYLLTEYLLER
ncbi:dipeptidyl peptidase IV N-terminal region-domain-containing protein [Choanephora cucurbitarum]|nr:dipeptidyl peptidase IV N-terminal region-domain-containing protein [Choanephora cucurbitarum]